MPRPLRVEFPDALYHITARGVQKALIVADDHDRVRWMEYLKEAVQRFMLELYAFVLMNNHYHLFVGTPHANLAKAMQYLNGAYAMYFNVRHDRGGHLFERRYRGILVENQGHYTGISRYIHLNPVRAGLVERPEEYPWSTYPGYHWGRMPLSWVHYERVLAEFGQGKDARKRYREFVADGIGMRIKPPWLEAVGGWLLGSKKFTVDIYAMLASNRSDSRWNSRAALDEPPLDVSLDTISDIVCKSHQVDKAALNSGTYAARAARGAIALIARRKAGISTKDIAAHLGYATSSAVSHAVSRAGERLDGDAIFNKRVSQIVRSLRLLSPKGV